MGKLIELRKDKGAESLVEVYMKYIKKNGEENKSRLSATLTLSFFYIAAGAVLTFVNTVFSPDYFASLFGGIAIVAGVSLGLGVVAALITRQTKLPFIATLINSILTAVFCAATMCIEQFHMWFAIYTAIMAIVMLVIGFKSAQKQKKAFWTVIVAISSVVVLSVMALTVFVLTPSSNGVRYSLNGNTYMVESVKNREDIEILSELNGKKVASIRANALRAAVDCRSLVIPTSITSIPGGLLYNLNKLEKLTFNPEAVATVLSYPLFGELWYPSTELSDANQYAVIPPNLTQLTIVGNVPDRYFYACSGIVSVAFDGAARRIGTYSFAFCEDLVQITSFGRVTELAQAAFGSCTSLTSVAHSNALRNVGIGAFDTCTSLLSFYFPNTVETVGSLVFSGANFYLKVYVEATQDEVLNNTRWDRNWDKTLNQVTGQVMTQVWSITWNCNNTATE